MTDHPILFTASMVRGLLREIERPGTGKTQTRRNGHLKRLRRFGAITEFGQSDTRGYDWHFRDRGMRWHDLRHSELLAVLPYQAGDRLWVREAWHAARSLNGTAPRDIPRDADIEYAATKRSYADIGLVGKPRPSMYLPRWASRITLYVTDVRVQRLQDISREDALAEGVQRVGGGMLRWENWSAAEGQSGTSPQAAYALLWNNINGPGSWDANPWVAAYTFVPRLGNIDAMPATAEAA
ncbi:hypothetical protein V5F77_02705 [Xanthobacter sp. DSM 24535]|uniref:hypothetical protein n=1 Tax=Roseixanthobacter psychrophilus TaxID=3119917 RepID=UPI00372AEB27